MGGRRSGAKHDKKGWAANAFGMGGVDGELDVMQEVWPRGRGHGDKAPA